MAKGKKYRAALASYDRQQRYPVSEAINIVREFKTANYDQTVEVAVNLGVNPKYADQALRGAVVLPNGTGKTIRVAVKVTEWLDAERVAFTLDGIDQEVRARGCLELTEERPELPPRTWWQRLIDFLLRREVALPSSGASHVVFTFAIDAGGPMAPMINAMLGPYADAVAYELLEKVAGHLEGDVAAA